MVAKTALQTAVGTVDMSVELMNDLSALQRAQHFVGKRVVLKEKQSVETTVGKTADFSVVKRVCRSVVLRVAERVAN